MHGRFTLALLSGAMSASLIIGCSSGADKPAPADSATATAPATDTAAAAPRTASLSDEIRAAEDAWRIALVSGDTAALAKLTAPEFTMPHPVRSGSRQTRKDLMGDIGGGLVQSDTSAISDLTVRGSGDTAVANLKFYWRPSRMGKPAKVETSAVEDTWVRRGGNWQLVARKSQ